MKKILAIALVMALLSIATIGGTLSYFTATDSDVNTMEVGNVKIEQLEQQRKDDGLVPFNATKLYPYTGDGTLVDGWLDTQKNAVDKIVSIQNTGSESAFIRTLFAFEAVDGTEPNPVVSGDILVNYNQDTTVGTWAYAGSFTKNSVTYYVYSFTYAKALAAGTDSVSAPRLKQIALNGAAGNSFSGGSYNILVLSQAVQSTGFGTAAEAFTAAFEINNTKLTEWFANVN